MKLFFKFKYGERGYGYLEHWENEAKQDKWYCRSGSCDTEGRLVNAIRPGVWTIREKPVPTDEQGMVVNGYGWKQRLWTPGGQWSHYLIHPDGNLAGTKGCLGLQNTDGRDLFSWFLSYFTKNPGDHITIYISNHYESHEPKESQVKKYSFLKGVLKSIRPAAMAGATAAVATGATTATNEVDIPTTAISTIVVWAVNLLVNWLKNR